MDDSPICFGRYVTNCWCRKLTKTTVLPRFLLFSTAVGVMKLIEPYSPALQEVTKATQRSVLAVMGSKRRPIFAIFVSVLLGAVAGWG